MLELARDIFILIFVLMLDQGLKSVQSDLKTTVNFSHCITYISKVILIYKLFVGKYSAQKYRVYHTNHFLMAFLLSA